MGDGMSACQWWGYAVWALGCILLVLLGLLIVEVTEQEKERRAAEVRRHRAAQANKMQRWDYD